MTSADSSLVDKRFQANAMASFIRIGAVLLLIAWCLSIVRPFVSIVVWGLVISIAIYPLHQSLTSQLGGREKLSVIVITLIGLAIIIVPGWLLGESTVGGLKRLGAAFQGGAVVIPPPGDRVADWPVIGDKVHAAWSSAATNLEATVNQYGPQLRALGQKVLGMATGTMVGFLQFVVSMIIAGALMIHAEGGYTAARNIARGLVGKDTGDKLADLSIQTIRSVVKGVLGVAFIQAILSAIGLVAIGVPAAGLWAGAVLVLAIVQLPPILILGPIAVWVFSIAEPVPATIFLVYAVVVSVSDMFLKPMLLGRGVETPMLVILIGAIGGAISEGIIGLFVGAVVLTLGYELLVAWMTPDDETADGNRATTDA